MKKIIQKSKIAIMVFLMGISLLPATLSTAPAYAAEQPEAAILTGCAAQEHGDGGGIICVVQLVVDILTALVGVLGVLGIIIVGIQYLTAAGNEEQARKAKRRLFEIILGLVLYVLLYSLLRWLLPNFNPKPSANPQYNTTSLVIFVTGA